MMKYDVDPCENICLYLVKKKKKFSSLGFRFYLFDNYCMGIWPLWNIQYSETRIRNKIKFITRNC